jgi:hypothetical protein
MHSNEEDDGFVSCIAQAAALIPKLTRGKRRTHNPRGEAL